MSCGIIRLFIFKLSLCFIISKLLASTPPQITLGVYESCPYFCWEKQPGYVYKLLHLFFEHMGTRMVTKQITLERASFLLAAKEIDIAVFPSYELHSQREIEPFGPALGVSYAGILHLKRPHSGFWDLSSLQNTHIVASPLGFLKQRLQEVIAKSMHHSEITQVSGKRIEQRLFKLVKMKRFNYAIHDFNILRYQIKNQKDSELQVSPSSILGFFPLRLATLHSQIKILKLGGKLSQFLTRLRRSPRFKEILQTYDIDDWYYLTY